MIPAVVPTAATVATTAAARGYRRGRRRHGGPDEPGAFGNPVGPNAPARCAVLTRSARPAGVLSVQAFSTCRRTPAGSSTGQASSPLAGRGIFGGGDVTPAALRRRRHSLRATACSQEPSLPGSRSPSSLEVAMRKVSRTTSAAASGPGNAKLQYA